MALEYSVTKVSRSSENGYVDLPFTFERGNEPVAVVCGNTDKLNFEGKDELSDFIVIITKRRQGLFCWSGDCAWFGTQVPLQLAGMPPFPVDSVVCYQDLLFVASNNCVLILEPDFEGSKFDLRRRAELDAPVMHMQAPTSTGLCFVLTKKYSLFCVSVERDVKLIATNILVANVSGHWIAYVNRFLTLKLFRIELPDDVLEQPMHQAFNDVMLEQPVQQAFNDVQLEQTMQQTVSDVPFGIRIFGRNKVNVKFERERGGLEVIEGEPLVKFSSLCTKSDLVWCGIKRDQIFVRESRHLNPDVVFAPGKEIVAFDELDSGSGYIVISRSVPPNATCRMTLNQLMSTVDIHVGVRLGDMHPIDYERIFWELADYFATREASSDEFQQALQLFAETVPLVPQLHVARVLTFGFFATVLNRNDKSNWTPVTFGYLASLAKYAVKSSPYMLTLDERAEVFGRRFSIPFMPPGPRQLDWIQGTVLQTLTMRRDAFEPKFAKWILDSLFSFWKLCPNGVTKLLVGYDMWGFIEANQNYKELLQSVLKRLFLATCDICPVADASLLIYGSLSPKDDSSLRELIIWFWRKYSGFAGLQDVVNRFIYNEFTSVFAAFLRDIHFLPQSEVSKRLRGFLSQHLPLPSDDLLDEVVTRVAEPIQKMTESSDHLLTAKQLVQINQEIEKRMTQVHILKMTKPTSFV